MPADAFPDEYFDVYIVLAKLAAFTDEELALAAKLNGKYGSRVILLTHRELEPYRLYERTEKDLKLAGLFAGSLEELALMTQHVYPALREKPSVDHEGG
jgi:hypothetical protein